MGWGRLRHLGGEGGLLMGVQEMEGTKGRM